MGGIIQSLDRLNRTKRWRKGEFALLLEQGICLLLTLDIGTPNSWAFGLKLGLTPSTPLVLRLLGLDWI